MRVLRGIGLKGGENVERKKKSDAQLFLERVEMYDTIVANKLVEQQQWKALALSITANMDGEKVKSSGSKSRMADAVIKCIDMEAEIDEAVDRLIDEKRKVIQTIEKLYSPMEYKILHLRYIQGLSLSLIAEKLNREYSWVTTTHGRALKNVERLLEK